MRVTQLGIENICLIPLFLSNFQGKIQVFTTF